MSPAFHPACLSPWPQNKRHVTSHKSTTTTTKSFHISIHLIYMIIGLIGCLILISTLRLLLSLSHRVTALESALENKVISTEQLSRKSIERSPSILSPSSSEPSLYQMDNAEEEEEEEIELPLPPLSLCFSPSRDKISNLF